MTEAWEDFTPEPLNLDSLVATPAEPPGHVTPNHRANGSTVEEPKPSVRERLMGVKKPKAPPLTVRNVKPKKVVPNKPGQFVAPLTDFYNFAAMAIMPFEPELSMTMVSPYKEPTEEEPTPPSVNERCAVAWDEAAQKSESVRRMLDAFTTVNTWGALVMAHAPIMMVLAKNHTPFGKKFDPAASMEAMLKKRAEQEAG